MAERMKRRELMKKIQELSFAKVECELYLDMYPDNVTALNYYNALLPELMKLMEEYRNKYGPIVAGASNNGEWSWASGKWPWQEMEDDD